MRTIRNKKIEECDDDGGMHIQDTRFERCEFESCRVSSTTDPRQRSTFDHVDFIRCSVRGTTIRTAVLREVTVEGLRTYGLLQTWGAVFAHTTLRGKIDRVMVSGLVFAGQLGRDIQPRFDEANRNFYSEVDWALDITEAEVKELDLRGVPGHLVRRDPETQVLVTRDAALQGAWRELPLDNTYWPVAIENLIVEGLDSCVLVAPKRHRQFKQLLRGLEILREAGFAS